MLRGAIQSTAPMVRASAVKPTLGVQRSFSAGDHPCLASPPAHSILASSEKLSLPIFVKVYNNHLPLMVRVCRGYCGLNEEMSISEGDHFNVHFVKQTKMVRMHYENGSKYNVPLNSSIPFGIIYNPSGNLSHAVKGFKFEKIADMLQKSPLPKVIRARKAYRGSSPDSSVIANELMVVLKAKSKLRGKQLKVFSLTLGREKVLSDNCVGHFSTRPRDVCLYLPEIVNHIPDIFPCKAVMFTQAEPETQKTPAKLLTSVVNLMHSSIESSLVATSILEEDPENARLLDIPIDLDILVRVVGTDESEDRKLYVNTAYFYDHFDPSRLCPYVNTGGAHETQSMLYTTVRRDGQGEHKGVDVVKPTRVPPAAQSTSVPSRPEYRSRPLPPEPFRLGGSPSPPPVAEKGEYDLTRHTNSRHQRNRSGSAADYTYIDIDAARVVRVTPPANIPYRRAGSEESSDSSYSGKSPSTPFSADGTSTDGSAGGTIGKNAQNTGSGSSTGVVEVRSRSHSNSSEKHSGNGTFYARRSPSATGLAGYASTDGSSVGTVYRSTHSAGSGSSAGVVEIRSRSNSSEKCSSRESHSVAFDSMLSELDDLQRELSIDGTENPSTPSDEVPGSSVYSLAVRIPSGLTIPEVPSMVDKLNLNGAIEEEAVEEDIYETMNPIEPSEVEAVAASRSCVEKNRKLLKALDGTQVLRLLEAMDMKEYQEKFTEHHINGDLFSECDEAILSEELLVTKRLHRMRLLKVISGQYSVSEIFRGRDGYVTMHPVKRNQ